MQDWMLQIQQKQEQQDSAKKKKIQEEIDYLQTLTKQD